jgi:hypothetical protein
MLLLSFSPPPPPLFIFEFAVFAGCRLMPLFFFAFLRFHAAIRHRFRRCRHALPDLMLMPR